MRRIAPLALLATCCLTPAGPGRADDPPPLKFDRKVDVIYGRKYGTALTMDVFTPKSPLPNGAGVVMIVSGGYFSHHDAVSPVLFLPLLQRGYTVFAVVHGSQPHFTVPEIVGDVNRAVRFIRHHARDYAIDPDRIGVTGASAGGHLSLMLGTDGKAGNPTARDPVDRESSRVRAVACFFPPTDFLNYGQAGRAFQRVTDFDKEFRPAFAFRQLDPAENLWAAVTDVPEYQKIAGSISPINFVTADDAPTLIVHGEADKLVPIQQSESMVERLEKAGVPARLVVKPDAGHGWLTMGKDMEAFADWFDERMPATTGKKP